MNVLNEVARALRKALPRLERISCPLHEEYKVAQSLEGRYIDIIAEATGPWGKPARMTIIGIPEDVPLEAWRPYFDEAVEIMANRRRWMGEFLRQVERQAGLRPVMPDERLPYPGPLYGTHVILGRPECDRDLWGNYLVMAIHFESFVCRMAVPKEEAELLVPALTDSFGAFNFGDVPEQGTPVWRVISPAYAQVDPEEAAAALRLLFCHWERPKLISDPILEVARSLRKAARRMESFVNLK